MYCALNEDQLTIQRTARELLADRLKPERLRSLIEAGESDDALWGELGELGWPGIALGEERGGSGLGLLELAVLCEALGYACAPVPFLPSVAAALLIDAAGSEAQRERWLPELASGAARGAAATDARLVPGAPGADVLVLVEDGRARLLDGAALWPGDADRPAAEGPLRSVQTIDASRDWAEVTAAGGDPLPGDPAPALQRIAVALAAEQLGIAQKALDLAVDYAKERHQFGRPIGAYQAVSHTLAELLLEVENARSLVLYAGWTDAGEPEARPLAAAMAKAAADGAALQATRRSLQVHGGIGFTWEHDLHFFLKRAHANAVLFGDAAAHEEAVAKELI